MTMSTNPPNPISPTPVEDAWALPLSPTRECALSGPCFAKLVDAAKRGGWEAVWTAWAEGEFVTEINRLGNPIQRPRRRRTLGRVLDRRSDLRAILDEAAQEKRSRLIAELEDEIEKIALGPGDITQDFNKQGQVTRVRTDKRNKVWAILQLLKAHDDRYTDRRKVEVEGQVDHRHAHAHLVGNSGGYSVDFESAQAALSADEARTLMVLLEKIENVRLERARLAQRQSQQPPALPPGDSQ